MEPRESSFFSMLVTLVMVTLVASLSLGFVFKWTEQPIAKANIEKQLKAIRAVVSGYTNDPVLESYKVQFANGNDSLEFFPARKDGKLIATAVKTFSPEGYSGDVWLMVGIDTTGSIITVAVVRHSETPGLGSKMSAPEFIKQFTGKSSAKNKLKVSKDGGEIDAISGATISSRAFSEAVELACETYKLQAHGNKN